MIKNTIQSINEKILLFITLSIFLTAHSFAGTDGKNEMSKNSNGEVKDCFEGINRGIFAFVLDNVIIEPIAKGYRYLSLIRLVQVML